MSPVVVGVLLDLYDGTGTPISQGAAQLTPTARLTNQGAGMLVMESPVRVEFRGGLPVVDLIPNDAPGLEPPGSAWRLSFIDMPGSPQGQTVQIPAGPAAFIVAAGNPAVFTWAPPNAMLAASGLPDGTGITLAGSLPAAFGSGHTYWVVAASGPTFQLARTPGGAPIATEGTGSGQLRVTQWRFSTLAAAGRAGTTGSAVIPRPRNGHSPAEGRAAAPRVAGRAPGELVAVGPSGEPVTLSELDGRYARVVSVLAFGAAGDGSTDDTAAVQAAIDYASLVEGVTYLPAAMYRVSQLVLPSGAILQGVSSGTYPDNNTIPGVSVLARLAGTNKDLILIPDGSSYQRIFDIAIDGNKNNNTTGYGISVADADTGAESQVIIQRCYVHDNPGSNIYLGARRRANKVRDCVCNYSLTGDGITVAGSDNTIENSIFGSNARAGICLGTTATQNWDASPAGNAVAVAHVHGNDIYRNQVGIALANGASDCIIMNNGIDRSAYQGITVYSGSSNSIVGNSFHSNGIASHNSYGHIDVASGVGLVAIDNNNFGPQDGDCLDTVAAYCVAVSGDASPVIGNIGVADPTAHTSGLANVAANAAPWITASNAGALIQGSGNDVLNLRNASGILLTRVTDSGSFVHLGGGAEFTGGVTVNGLAGATAGARFAGGTVSGAPSSGSFSTGDFVADQSGAIWVCVAGGSPGAWVQSGGRPSPGPATRTGNWTPGDQGLIAWSQDPAETAANSQLPAAGTLYLCRVHVTHDARVTSILTAVTSSNSTLTAEQCFAALYRTDGSLVAATGDQSLAWATPGLKTMPLSGGPADLVADDYYIGIYANGSTLPNFARGNNQIAGLVNAGMSSGFRFAIGATRLTGPPPSSAGDLSASTFAWWLALS
jgi:parallel beta-helix repeat protein